MDKKQISSGAEKAEELTRKKQNIKNGETEKTSVKTVKKVSSSGHSAGAIEKNAQNNAQKSKKTDSLSHSTGAIEKTRQKTATNEVKKGQIKAEGAKLSPQDEKKLKASQLKAEKRQKVLERKQARKENREKKIASIKAKQQERKQKLHASAQQTKQERLAKIEARNAKRQARLAEIRAERERKLKERAQKRAENKEKHRTPGFGGWLAAVITLGSTTLILGTMLTYGWINSNGMRADMAGEQTQSVYELNSVIDNLDSNLAKARVSNSTYDQTRVLSQIAIESEMAEIIMERMPLDCTVTEKTVSFVNKMGDSAKNMLYKVASGEKLSQSDKNAIEYMYQTNLKIKRALNEMTTNMTEKDLMAWLDGKKDCIMMNTFGDLQNNAIETPKEIQDGPFSSSIEKTSAKNLEALKEITAPNAEELAKKYFKDYKISEAKCTGEALGANGVELFNVSLKVEGDDENEMLAQISKKGGKVVLFDSYKECANKNFSVDRCIDIAEDFLEDLGYDDLEAVWTSENGTTCNLNFVYEDDDVIFYPDMIKVKVCEERGIVTGVEALSYVLNHTERNAEKATVSRSDAKKAISADVQITGERLTVIPFEGEERLAWEFAGFAQDRDYYIYVDAKTGVEIEVLTVVGTKQGRALY